MILRIPPAFLVAGLFAGPCSLPTARATSVQETTESSEPAAQAVSLVPMDQLLPADVQMHLEFAGLAEWRERLGSTALGDLGRNDEVQAFLKPVLARMRGRLEWLIAEAPEVTVEVEDRLLLRQLLEDLPIGRLTLSFFDAQALLSDGDEIGRAVLGVEVGEFSGRLFALLQRELHEADADAYSEVEVMGRTTIRLRDAEDEDFKAIWIREEPGRLLVGFEDDSFPFLFGEGGARLASAEWYSRLRTRLGVEGPLAFAALSREMMAAVPQEEEIDEEMFEDLDDEDLRAYRFYRELSALDAEDTGPDAAVAVAIETQGRDLRTVFYYDDDTTLEGVGVRFLSALPDEHLALVPKDADLLACFAISWKETGADIEELRAKRIALADKYQMDLSDYSPFDAFWTEVAELETRAGIPIRERLVPCLGERVTLWLDVPSSTALIPPAGTVLDLADPAAFDVLLDEVLEKDAALDVVDFSVSQYKGAKVVTVTLRNAGLPILPSFARVGDQLLVALTPQSLKGLISSHEKGDTFAATQKPEELRAALTGRETMAAMWTDLSQLVSWGYLAASAALSTFPADMLDVFDPATLPSRDAIVPAFGRGLTRIEHVEGGLRGEGVSTLGEPLSGSVLLVFSIVGLFGMDQQVEDLESETKQGIATQRMQEIALALRSYRDSVGGGSFPENLVQLLDRGFLDDPGLLVDPADDAPRKVRTGTGERIPVSFSLAITEGLDRYYGPEGTHTVLKTRGAWYDHWSGDAYLVVILDGDNPSILRIPAEHWDADGDG